MSTKRTKLVARASAVAALVMLPFSAGVASAAGLTAGFDPGPSGGDKAQISGPSSPAGSATSSNTGPKLIDCGSHQPVVKPNNIIFACADAGLVVDDIHWSSWGPDVAEGDGTEHRNLCQPNCAEGTFVTSPAHVVLTDVNADGLFTKGTATTDDRTDTYPMPTR
jgi:hypothetical protein